jgi:cysteine desulfurase/selenocysteine lyase
MQRFGLEGTVRASFSVYNTKSEIDKMTENVAKIAKIKNK